MRLLSAVTAAVVPVALAAAPATAVSASPAGKVSPAKWRISRVTRLPQSTFYDAVALSPTDVWALGKYAIRQGPLVSMVWHWNGRTWRRAPFPVSADGLSVFPAIAGTSPENLWAFNYTFALHWNGHRWSLAHQWKGDPDFKQAFAINRHDVWAIGANSTWRYNGRRWRQVKVPFSIFQASAVAANDVWAVGVNNKGQVLARWRDGSWSYTRLPAYVTFGKVLVFSLLAEKDGDVWLGGGAFVSGGFPGAGVLLRYHNGRWHEYHGRSSDDVRSIVPDGSGGVWAAYDQPGGPAALAHINGRGWHQVRLPGVRGKQTAAGLLARPPRSSAVFAFGELDWSSLPTLSYGVMLRYAR